MPLVTPKPDESRDAFVSRCMADQSTQDITGDSAETTQARRLAACERQFDDAKKSATLDGFPESFGMKAIRDVTVGDESKGEVTAVVATFDEVDNDGEVILAGAIPDGMKVTGSFYNHDTVMGQMLGTGTPDAPPVSKGVIRVTGKQATAHLNYFMETQRGREAFLTVKAMGADQAWSFAYRKADYGQATGEWKAKGARMVLAKLGPLLDGAMEVSPVKMPGGKGTGTIGVKAADTRPTASVDGTEHPAADFAYVPDAEKPSTWKLPIFDAAHVRNALARWDQTDIPAADKAAVHTRILEAARKFEIDVTAEAKKSAADASLDAAVALRLRRMGKGR